MTDVNQPAPNPPVPRRIRRSPVIAAVALTALAGTLVLYGMRGDDGKEMAGASGCATARSTAARLASFARGEVAALAVDQSPQPLVELSFDAPQGQRRSLADFHGRTVLLNLWATWCIPCRQEMPALDRLQAKLGGADFEVVAIDIDTARLDRRQAFLDQAGVKSLAFYADPSAEVFERLKQAGKVVGLPTTLILDPHGCALGTMAGPAQWDLPDAVNLVMAALGK
jgi:thiol-disulfide isomerase/thioredoxin